MSESIKKLAERHLPGDYTIERREFTDGDRRDTAVHALGYGEVGCRTETRLWKESGNVCVDYYEHDVLRTRDVYNINLQNRIV